MIPDYATIAAEHVAWARSQRMKSSDVVRALGLAANRPSWPRTIRAVAHARKLLDAELDRRAYDVECEMLP